MMSNDNPPITIRNGDYLTIEVDPNAYKERIELYKFSLIAQVILSKGDSPWKLANLCDKLQTI